MPASTPIPDSDVHNIPGIGTIPDEDVHNHPVQSEDPSDPTPVVSPTNIDASEVPEFERPAANGTTLTAGSEPGSIAHVDPSDPDKLAVDTPSRYTSAVQAHELTHQIQNAAGNTNDVDSSRSFQTQADIDKVYGYGGTEGLDKVMKSGGINKLNKEQQASIPQSYMKEYNRLTKAGDAKGIDRLNQVYEPAIKQLRSMADTRKDQINTTPDAPAAPPAELTGQAVPVKGMLSKSTESKTLPPGLPKGAHVPTGGLKGWKDAAGGLGRKQ